MSVFSPLLPSNLVVRISAMRTFKQLGRRNRDGSFQNQHDQESILALVANQLSEGGFKHLRAQGLQTKHAEHLVQRWHAEGISAGTFKNRMSALRRLVEKIDKQNIVARENAAYGIADRRHVTNACSSRQSAGGLGARASRPTQPPHQRSVAHLLCVEGGCPRCRDRRLPLGSP